MKTRIILAATIFLTVALYLVLPASAGHKDIIDYPGYHMSPLDSPLQPTTTPPPVEIVSTPEPAPHSGDVAPVALPAAGVVEQPQYRYTYEQGQANGR